MTRSSREAARSLRATAQDQGGYITAKQAISAGYGYPHLDYPVSSGAFERIESGLYRLTNMPVAEDDDPIRLSLWSRNREVEPQAVVSHESAHVLHELTGLLPDRVHLTVPPGFRNEPPMGCVLHKAVLTPAEAAVRSALRLTFAARATHALPASLRPPPASRAVDFPAMAAEAALSTGDYLAAFAILVAFRDAGSLDQEGGG